MSPQPQGGGNRGGKRKGVDKMDIEGVDKRRCTSQILLNLEIEDLYAQQVVEIIE